MAFSLIAGLGNPGKTYEKTRHNIGFRVIDAVAKALGVASFKEDHKKFLSLYATTSFHGKQLVLVKPLTYMNRSGEAIQKWVNYYHIPYHELLIIVDDIAIPFGTIRFRKTGSSGGHNGLKSIIECLGTEAFPRLRIGIGNAFPYGKQADYVLSPFTPEEETQLEQLMPILVQAVLSFEKNGIEYAMQHFNGKNLISAQG